MEPWEAGISTVGSDCQSIAGAARILQRCAVYYPVWLVVDRLNKDVMLYEGVLACVDDRVRRILTAMSRLGR